MLHVVATSGHHAALLGVCTTDMCLMDKQHVAACIGWLLGTHAIAVTPNSVEVHFFLSASR